MPGYRDVNQAKRQDKFEVLPVSADKDGQSIETCQSSAGMYNTTLSNDERNNAKLYQ